MSYKRRNVFATLLASIFMVLNVISIILSRFRFYEMQYVREGVLKIFSWLNFKTHLSLLVVKHAVIPDHIFFLILLGSLLGIYHLFHTSWRKAILIVGVPLTFFLLYVSYQFNAYPRDGSITDMRYTTIWLPLFSGLSGVGFHYLFSKASLKRGLFLIPFSILIISLLSFALHWNKFFPPSTFSSMIQEHKARLIFERANPQCLYISPFAFDDSIYGINSVGYRIFAGRNPRPHEAAVIAGFPCLIFFESTLCSTFFQKECSAISHAYPWQKLPYEALPTFQLASSSGETLKLQVPPPREVLVKSSSFFEFFIYKGINPWTK